MRGLVGLSSKRKKKENDVEGGYVTMDDGKPDMVETQLSPKTKRKDISKERDIESHGGYVPMKDEKKKDRKRSDKLENNQLTSWIWRPETGWFDTASCGPMGSDATIDDTTQRSYGKRRRRRSSRRDRVGASEREKNVRVGDLLIPICVPDATMCDPSFGPAPKQKGKGGGGGSTGGDDSRQPSSLPSSIASSSQRRTPNSSTCRTSSSGHDVTTISSELLTSRTTSTNKTPEKGQSGDKKTLLSGRSSTASSKKTTMKSLEGGKDSIIPKGVVIPISVPDATMSDPNFGPKNSGRVVHQSTRPSSLLKTPSIQDVIIGLGLAGDVVSQISFPTKRGGSVHPASSQNPSMKSHDVIIPINIPELVSIPGDGVSQMSDPFDFDDHHSSSTAAILGAAAKSSSPHVHLDKIPEEDKSDSKQGEGTTKKVDKEEENASKKSNVSKTSSSQKRENVFVPITVPHGSMSHPAFGPKEQPKLVALKQENVAQSKSSSSSSSSKKSLKNIPKEERTRNVGPPVPLMGGDGGSKKLLFFGALFIASLLLLLGLTKLAPSLFPNRNISRQTITYPNQAWGGNSNSASAASAGGWSGSGSPPSGWGGSGNNNAAASGYNNNNNNNNNNNTNNMLYENGRQVQLYIPRYTVDDAGLMNAWSQGKPYQSVAYLDPSGNPKYIDVGLETMTYSEYGDGTFKYNHLYHYNPGSNIQASYEVECHPSQYFCRAFKELYTYSGTTPWGYNYTYQGPKPDWSNNVTNGANNYNTYNYYNSGSTPAPVTPAPTIAPSPKPTWAPTDPPTTAPTRHRNIRGSLGYFRWMDDIQEFMHRNSNATDSYKLYTGTGQYNNDFRKQNNYDVNGQQEDYDYQRDGYDYSFDYDDRKR